MRTWTASLWFTGDSTSVITTAITRTARGVVFPVNYNADGSISDPEVAALL
ncbi:MAG: hypothetical protein ACE5GJ_14335 [Gemmatimonadota bacterium]